MSGWGELRSAVAAGDLSGLGRLDISRENAEAYVRSIPLEVLGTQGLGQPGGGIQTLAGVPWCTLEPGAREHYLDDLCRAYFEQEFPAGARSLVQWLYSEGDYYRRSYLVEHDAYARAAATLQRLYADPYTRGSHEDTNMGLQYLLDSYAPNSRSMPAGRLEVLRALVVARAHARLRATAFEPVVDSPWSEGYQGAQGHVCSKQTWTQMTTVLGNMWAWHLLAVEP